MTRWVAGGLARAISVALLLLAGCDLLVEPTASPPAPATPGSTPSPAPSDTPDATDDSPSPSPSPSPEPSLTLALPSTRDARVVAVSVSSDVALDSGGTITIMVRNLSDSRIDEILLRWPTAVDETLFLAPFQASEDRIRDGGPPLVQPWTRWVEGPGEQGEPAGTTTLGYGPMDPGMELQIALFATRRAPGPLAFDLQLLADEAILSLDGEAPATIRVTVP